MSKAKIHIAAKATQGGQKCARCHTTISAGRGCSFWAEGAQVMSRGDGSWHRIHADEGDNFSDVRPCGKREVKRG